MKRAICIIPARFSSKRLPGKVLLKIKDKPLIQHVYENASCAKMIEKVIVTTDSERIASAVRSFGGEAVILRGSFRSGTDRVAALAKDLSHQIIINLQADEPGLKPSALDQLVRLMWEKGVYYATLAIPCRDRRLLEDPSKVKIVQGKDGYALYFSRSLIPHGGTHWLLHIGVYGYKRDFLLKFANLPRSALEELEDLEQLRALEYGYKIKLGILRSKYPGAIDTLEDYKRFLSWR
jgi:3-deoxy-manno-octulosonate cytidylyltransferase (CMP-KDO synthetase)